MPKPGSKITITIAAALWFSAMMFLFIDVWHVDLSALYMAGYLFSTDQQELLYATSENFFGRTPEIWQTALAGSGYENRLFLAYIYPPLWGWVVAPLTSLFAPQTFFNIFLVFHAFSMLVATDLASRLSSFGRLSRHIWVVAVLVILGTSVSGLTSMMNNQFQMAVVLLIVLSFTALLNQRPGLAGAILALATAMKVTPLMLVFVFLVARQWRAVFWFCVIGLLLAGISILVAGWPLHEVYLAQLHNLANTTGLSATNASIEPLLVQLDHFINGIQAHNGQLRAALSVDEPFWVRLVTRGGFLAGLAWVWFATRNRAPAARIRVSLLATCILLVVTGPFAGTHYYVLPIVLLPVVSLVLNDKSVIRWVIVVGLASNIGLYQILFEFNHLALFTDMPQVFAFGGLFIHLMIASARPQ